MEFIGAYPGQASTLAIDNIKLTNCGRPAPTTGNCPFNQIKCKNNVCMNAYGLCDGINDCGDNSDESHVYCQILLVNSCTFETNGVRPACNWTQETDPGSNARWMTMSSLTANTNQNMIRMTGPTFDHTYRLADR